MVDLFFYSAGRAPCYLDGGTGSLVLQATLAGIVTAAYFVKTKWFLLKACFAGKKPPLDG